MDEFRGWKLVLLTFGIFLLVTSSGFGFDRMLRRDGVNSQVITLSSNSLTGLVVAGLFLELVRNVRNRRRMVQARLEVIADMNHHIRNALQIITYAASAGKDDESVDMIRRSVERIEWALREVLPRDLPYPTPEPPADKSPDDQNQPSQPLSAG